MIRINSKGIFQECSNNKVQILQKIRIGGFEISPCKLPKKWCVAGISLRYLLNKTIGIETDGDTIVIKEIY